MPVFLSKVTFILPALTMVATSKLVTLTGSITPEKRKKIYKDAQIIFITPQTLQNDLIRGLSLEDTSLIIFDEAHKLSAHKKEKTARYRLAEALRDKCDALLLLTATPHSGDSFAFYSLIQLIDPYIFKDPSSIVPQKLQKIMIRRGKGRIKKADGTPVFKKREVVSIPISYTPEEMELYDEVTEYVVNEYNLAQREGDYIASFAMIILQKRMASSIYSLENSLKKRKQRIYQKLKKELYGSEGLTDDEFKQLRDYQSNPEDFDLDIDELEDRAMPVSYTHLTLPTN